MAQLDEGLLERRMTEVERARQWSPRVISKFEGLLRSSGEAELHRANPLAFARERGVGESEAIDLFLHAARAGLFQMNWDVLCPHSGMVLDSFGTLRSLNAHYACGLCNIEGETQLDDFVEVTFTVDPLVRHLSLHDPDQLSVEDFYWKLRFSGTGRLPGGGPRFLEFLQPLVRALTFLPSGSVTRVHAEVGSGAISGVNAQNQTGFTIPVSELATAMGPVVRLNYDDSGFKSEAAAAPPGMVEFEVANTANRRGSLLLINWPPEIIAMTEKPALEFEPYLSGGMLLTRQTFRRLFRSERVEDSEGLGVRQVTLLFTDLKGSTALYERLGDLNAYALVRQHFTLIAGAVQAHSGAVVKTIGDAVMAAFFRAEDAVSAALHMLAEMSSFNRARGATDIILKIGAHSGHSIAVTLNENLDYFGQTVNIAARVQALADAGEICLSETVYTAPGVRDLLASHQVATCDVSLRGIEGGSRVYRVAAAET
jgi:class 3 adenylate cyclase